MATFEASCITAAAKRPKRSNPSGLSLRIPRPEENKLPSLLELNLGSPFKVSGIHDTLFPLAIKSTIPSTNSHVLVSSLDEVCAAYLDSDSEDGDDDDDDEAQYISISPSSRFYNCPPPLRTEFSPWVQEFTDTRIPFMSFSCDALVPESPTEIKSPAELFHQELEQVIPLLVAGIAIDEISLPGVDMQLYQSPVQVFQDMCLDTLNPSTTYTLHPLQDSCTHDGYDSEESESDTESGSLVKSDSGIISLPPTSLRRPAGLVPTLDRRLVAPFESETSLPSDNLVPSSKVCGLRARAH